MTIEQLRRVHRAQPFQPFRLQLADSRSVDVTHPEILAINEPGRTVSVVSDGAFEIIDLLLVVSLELLNGHAKPTRRGRR
jgi:hypothetical protein